jgi:hypothetical protein
MSMVKIHTVSLLIQAADKYVDSIPAIVTIISIPSYSFVGNYYYSRIFNDVGQTVHTCVDWLAVPGFRLYYYQFPTVWPSAIGDGHYTTTNKVVVVAGVSFEMCSQRQ